MRRVPCVSAGSMEFHIIQPGCESVRDRTKEAEKVTDSGILEVTLVLCHVIGENPFLESVEQQALLI